MKWWKIAIFLLIFGFCLPGQALAAETETVLLNEKFDTPDWQTHWTVARNSQWESPIQPCLLFGQFAKWQQQQNFVGMEIAGPGCTSELVSATLDLSSVPHYRYEFDWQMNESLHMDRAVIFRWQNANNWYDLKLLDDTMMLQKVLGGLVYTLHGQYVEFPFQVNHVAHFSIEVDGTDISVSIDGQPALHAIDEPPFIAGPTTLGLQAATGAIYRSISFFTNLVVTAIGDFKRKFLPIPILKQRDPAWANLTYDHAERWSKTPTIGQWGCGITAMTSVLLYYGINILPNGQGITPATLNAWLSSQPDGYLGDGLVNWEAVSRLTYLVNQHLGTPKLEYLWSPPDFQQAAKDILNNQPVIFQVPGHFYTVNGLTENGQFWITDPWYDYTRSDEPARQVLSMRRFTPSFTDLSYLLVTHDPQTSITLHDSRGATLSTTEDANEVITNQEQSSEQTAPLALTLYPKPADNTYVIQVTSNQTHDTTVQTYAYDQFANPTVLFWHGTLSSTTNQIIQLDFHKQQPSTFSLADNFTQLRTNLAALSSLRDIQTFTVYQQLDTIAKNAEKSGPHHQHVYLGILSRAIGFYQQYLTAEASEFLQSELKLIAASLHL